MKPIYQFDKYRTGLVGIGLLAFLVAMVIGASTLNIGARSYTAELANTGGLRVTEPVQVAGVTSGKVTGLELDGDKVKVTFTVDKDVKLGKDTRLDIKISTLLGTHYLAVMPAGSGDMSGSIIPVDHTHTPFNLQDVIEQGTPHANAYNVVTIEKSLQEMANVLGTAGGEVKPALVEVGKLSNLIASRSDDIGKLLDAASTVTKQLTDSSDDILSLMKASDLILDTLNTRRETIHKLLVDLGVLGTELNGVLQDTKADLGPTLRDLNTAVALLKAHEKNLGLAVDNLATAAKYVANAAGAGTWVNLHSVGGSLPDAAACGRGILC
jgi:phospholipid/cholesterol/gamma-HCH transport system substrate-binding protein